MQKRTLSKTRGRGDVETTLYLSDVADDDASMDKEDLIDLEEELLSEGPLPATSTSTPSDPTSGTRRKEGLCT